MKKLFLLASILLGGFVLLFYYTLRSSTWDMSHQAPYMGVAGKTLILQRPASLCKNIESFVIKAPYFITEATDRYDGVVQIAHLPKGTPLLFSQAYHHHNAVSGNTTSLLVGQVHVASLKKTFGFEYQWGTKHTICIEKPCGYWTFPLAIWQTQIDTNRYVYER